MHNVGRQVSSSGTIPSGSSTTPVPDLTSTSTNGSSSSGDNSATTSTSTGTVTQTSPSTIPSPITASTTTDATSTTTTTSLPDSTATIPPPVSSTKESSSTTSISSTTTTTFASSSTKSSSIPPPSPSSRLSSSTASFTTSFTTITTAFNGQLTTVTSPLPTSLSSSVPTTASPNRTAIIAGSTTAAVVLILLLLAGVFLHHRHKLRQRQALVDRDRVGPREGRGLLDGEDFDDEDTRPMTMHSYHDSLPSVSMAVRSASPQSPTHSLYRSRTSEAGSIFREEEVWPPPAEFVDPFLSSVRRNQEVDLGRIVDDVMGPRRGHTPTTSSSSRNDVDRGSSYRTHRASDSDTSYTGLLDTHREHRRSQSSFVSLYTDPYSPSRDSMIGSGAAKSTVTLPPGTNLGLGYDPIVIAPGAYSLQPPARALQNPAVSALSGVGVSRPKLSSPLARAMSNASIKMGDKTRLWLERKVRRGPMESGSGRGNG